MAIKRPRLLLLITEDWYFWSHRLPIARAARDAGYDVVIATRVQEHGERIAQEGLRVVPIALRRQSRSPLFELASIADLVRLYRQERPVLVHHVSVKPVLYGSIAARIAGVPAVVNAVAGLGHVFVAGGLSAPLMRTAIRSAYRLVLSARNSRVIFQTEADRRQFVGNGMVDLDRAVVIRGAGVDVDVFTPAPEPAGPMVILLAARLLWNKGVADLIEAGVRLRRDGHICRIVLVGVPDTDNPQAIPEAQLAEWQRAGLAEWWGRRDDMPAVIRQAAVVVLPTYYGEGVPKILLEAAASGRPIVASDQPGCCDVVEDGISGFIVPARDSSALSVAIGRLLKDPALRHRMGQAGRLRVSREFGDKLVVSQTLNVYRDLLLSRGLVREAAALS